MERRQATRPRLRRIPEQDGARASVPGATRARPLIDLALELIWREGNISRADIARALELSRSTVSELVAGLLDTGLVAELGDGPSRGGRRPIMLGFQDDAHVILGVDMGATHVSVALTDLRGRVLAWEARDHPVRTDPAGTRQLIRELSEAALRSAPSSLMGIGIAIPSPVDPQQPDVLSQIVLPDWKGTTGFDVFRDHFGVPLLVDNDANLGALAEYWWGALRGRDELAFIKVATGIGSGHIIRGEIHRGATGVAGEMGHIAIDPNGIPCVCGNRGCLGTLVGTQALIERTQDLLSQYPDSILADSEITIMSLEDAALEDDPLAMRVVREAGQNLGIVIAGLLNLMNPSSIVLGGGLTRLGERLLIPIREVVMQRTLLNSVAATEIRTSELGPRNVAVGAATLVLEAALEDPRLFPRFAA